MNKTRRAAIDAIVTDIQVRLAGLMDQIYEIRDEEQEYFDNMPESFRLGEKGSTAECAVNALESAASLCDSALDEILDNLEELTMSRVHEALCEVNNFGLFLLFAALTGAISFGSYWFLVLLRNFMI